jgi:DNA-directed RNA polymerase subunit E'
MYKILTVKDRVKVPPEKFGLPLKDSVKAALEEEMESKIDPSLGVVLAVISVEEVGEGKILPEDPCVHYETVFKILVYKPELHELIAGEVVDNAEFGAFIRVGPLDGLVHISQIMDDFVSYDNKNSIFVGKQTRKTLKEGDKVRARIISVSWAEQHKIGLTMRQAGLGNLIWLEEEKKKKK